jgi:hypothetical protein
MITRRATNTIQRAAAIPRPRARPDSGLDPLGTVDMAIISMELARSRVTPDLEAPRAKAPE